MISWSSIQRVKMPPPLVVEEWKAIATLRLPAQPTVQTHRIVTHFHGWARVILGRLSNPPHAIKAYPEVLGVVLLVKT